MATDNQEVTTMIEWLGSPQKEICEQLRRMIGTEFPDLAEKWRWSRPIYATGDGNVCLSSWYRSMNSQCKEPTVFAPFAANTDYFGTVAAKGTYMTQEAWACSGFCRHCFGKSSQMWMINFRV